MTSPIRFTLSDKMKPLRGAPLSVLLALAHSVPGKGWHPVHVQALSDLSTYSHRHVYVALDILQECGFLEVRSCGRGRSPEFLLFPSLDYDLEFPLSARLHDPAVQLQETTPIAQPDSPSDVLVRPLVPSPRVETEQ